MSSLDSDNFYELRKIANNRLRPDAIAAWFLASCLYSGIIFLISYLSVYKGVYINKEFWKPILLVFGILLLIQVIIFIFFKNTTTSYKYQRLQAIILSFIATKMSIDGYLVAFIGVEVKSLNYIFFKPMIIMLIGGLILLLISTLRAISKAKKGCYRKGELGIYNFKNNKGYIGFSGIFAIVMLGRAIISILSNDGTNNVKTIAVIMTFTFIQYVMALVIPEFYLLSYCKFKYDDFNVEIPRSFIKTNKA